MDLVIGTYGTRIRSTSERIVLSLPKVKEKIEYPIRRIDKIVITAASSISSEAVKLALQHDVDIVYLNNYGAPVGRIFPSTPKGISEVRRAQIRFSASEGNIALARCLVLGKARNQIRLLESLQARYDKDLSLYIVQATTALETLQTKTDRTRDQLLGSEGYIAERYFGALRELHDFPGRHPRGHDSFNSCFNYGYGILYNEMERACQYTGLDPNLGIFHEERYGKPALVLDLVEEFRVAVVDSVLFPLLVDGEFKGKRNFTGEGEQRVLSPSGKRKVVEAVCNRLHEKVRWDDKTQELSAVLAHQTLMMSHFFMGRKTEYEPFRLSALSDFSDEQ